MSEKVEKTNKQALKRLFLEAYNAGQLDVIEELVSPELIDHMSYGGVEPGSTSGPLPIEALRSFIREMRRGFPDIEYEVKDLIAERDLVASRVGITGTHNGMFLGMPPTGQRISVTIVDLVRFEDGLAVEHWGDGEIEPIRNQLSAPAIGNS